MSADHPDRTTELLGASAAVASDRRSPLEPGSVLNGRYRIEKELGRGGIGVVYLARDERLHSLRVVVKLLLERLGDCEDRAWFEKKFKDEIRALAQIDHPGVVRALDVGELPDGRSYLVMQYVCGVDLRSFIQPPGMDLARVAALIRQIGHALSAAHQQGVLHRDLKPENIMLQTADSEAFVKLIDFGMATVLDSPGSGKTTIVAGTIHYMAPEQMQGRPCGPSDIFALGVIAYEMATGRRPFNPSTPYELVDLQRAGVEIQPRLLRPDLPEAAQAVILRALAFDPHRRYQSASEFGDRLADALTPGLERESGRSLSVQHTGIQLAHLLLAELDGYSKMTIEEQTRGLEQLQAAVRRTTEFQQAHSTDQLISQTAAGGMALAFFGTDPLVAVRCAVEIADALPSSEQLKVRIAVHTGPIKVIPDINERPNVSGDGLDTAHRVIGYGEAGQVLVSRTVADVLRHLSGWSWRLKDLGDRRIEGKQRVHIFSVLLVGSARSDSRAAMSVADVLARIFKARLRVVVGMLVVAVLLVIMWWQRSFIPAVVPKHALTYTEPVRTLTYAVIAQKNQRRYPGSKPLPASDGMKFEAGDRVRLSVITAEDGHLYLINERPLQVRGIPQLNLLFPNTTNNGGAAEVKANQLIQIPDSGNNPFTNSLVAARVRSGQGDQLLQIPENGDGPEHGWFVFDNEDGIEWLWLVWSAQTIAELEAVKSRTISEPAEFKSIADFLAAHSPVDLEMKKDVKTKATTVSARADVIVGLVKLEHSRREH